MSDMSSTRVPLSSHELHSFSDLMIAFRFINERTNWFPGNCLDHVSGFPPFSSNEEAFCETCTNCHRSFKVSLQHSMIPIKDIKKSNIDSCISGVVNERTNWFPGNCLDHVSGFPPFSSNDTSRRHIGHLKPVDLSPFTDDVICVWMHASQNVWRHGRYFGFNLKKLTQYLPTPQ
jgi:hypothetical protein